ncbi:hypothetical protein F5888DRAFT_1636511 [Russula emetica]|nr:hypothetical protein F5888DRAFT_1636511 [Russula emetica]
MVAAQMVSPIESTPLTTSDSESVLDLELTDFCTRLHITPDIREFHDDEDGSDPHLCVSDKSSDIEEVSQLNTSFTNAFRMGQLAVLKKEKENKRKRQDHIDMVSKGFRPVDEYFRHHSHQANQENREELTSEMDNVINIVQDEIRGRL